MELPPITDDDRRVAADAADMVLPKQRPAAEDNEDPLQPLSESLPESPSIEAAGLTDDGDTELLVPEGVRCPIKHVLAKPFGCPVA